MVFQKRSYARTLPLDFLTVRAAEAWRAVTERGELLCVYSVDDLAEELSGVHRPA
jgi:hypothetical protein